MLFSQSYRNLIEIVNSEVLSNTMYYFQCTIIRLEHNEEIVQYVGGVTRQHNQSQ